MILSFPCPGFEIGARGADPGGDPGVLGFAEALKGNTAALGLAETLKMNTRNLQPHPRPNLQHPTADDALSCSARA